MNDEIIVERPSNNYGIPGIRWVNYLTSPTMKVRVQHPDGERSRTVTDATVNTDDVAHVKRMLQRIVREARVLAKSLGSKATYPEVTDAHAAQYVGKWKGTRDYQQRLDRALRQAESYDDIPKPPKRDYVSSPVIDLARDDVQRVAKRYEAAPSLYEYRNAYGEPARMFQL